MLRLRYVAEDEWHGELHAQLDSEGFAGVGSAWFDAVSLREFCERLGDYPLRAAALPSLAGGFWDPKSSGAVLEQTLLSVRVLPQNARGSLRVEVIVAEPTYDDAEPVRRAQAWFVVTYSDLARFQSAFSTMLAGRVAEVVLRAEPT